MLDRGSREGVGAGVAGREKDGKVRYGGVVGGAIAVSTPREEEAGEDDEEVGKRWVRIRQRRVWE